jgi:Domain of unknown function (DUF1996)/RTX calcium-binding nonapeptide repeat (4 copies)
MRSKISLLACAALVVIGMLPGPFARASTTSGVFSVHCAFSHRAPDDPIVHPGHAGGAHSHDFFGNRSTHAGSTYASMVEASTTCQLPEDTSAYWVPSLLTPSGTPAPVRDVFAYYRNLPVYGGPPTAYPEDFRMIAGHPTVNTGTKMLGWSCNDRDPYLATPPDCGTNRLKLHLLFPSCWDGVNIDSPNHRSHVAYPAGRYCPETHPVKVPRMSLHITYGVSDGRGYQLSSDAENGTSNGQSAHGDFWNTWDQSALEELVARCLEPGKSCLKITSMSSTGGGSGGSGGTSDPGGNDGDGSRAACQQTPLTLRGTAGSDDLSGTVRADVAATFKGRDVVRSKGSGDRICAGAGPDRILGGSGPDRLLGSDGADVLRGGPGKDVLFGGPGRDLLMGGPGQDTCVGGPGDDLARSCEIRRGV